MPAPNRRNKGEALAHHVEAHASPRSIDDHRDRLRAQSHRADAKWEAAASVLERRASQVRVDYERGRNFDLFERAVREGRAKPPTIPAPLRIVGPRFWLGYCLDCDCEMWTHRSRPRVPLCQRCRDKREVRRVS